MKKQLKINSVDVQLERRRIVNIALLGGAAVTSGVWSKPVINAVMLPAHAQTSVAMCTTDNTVGGPLAGNASGATTCQAACEAEAADMNAELCAVNESTDASGATLCECELDLP